MSQELLVKDQGVIARIEIDTQISTAKMYPRDAKKSMEYAAQLATMDEETAESCFYALVRKNKDGTKKEIRGKSIRLAEIIANAWGNLHAATRIVENDGLYITAEGCAWDLETNVRITMQTKVSIQFKDSKGKLYTANADMQTTLSNAASAKALRNAIFKVIPNALADRVLEKAMKYAVGDQKTLVNKSNKLFDRFKLMGIGQEKILNFFEKEIEEIDLNDIEILIGLGTAIKEGMIKIDEAFSITEENKLMSPHDRIKQAIENKNNSANKSWVEDFDKAE